MPKKVGPLYLPLERLMQPLFPYTYKLHTQPKMIAFQTKYEQLCCLFIPGLIAYAGVVDG